MPISEAPERPATPALCGIVLHPAGHTRSPAMHNAAYAALGLDAHYQAFDVRPEQLPAAIEGVRALGLAQVAVSIPHKEAVLARVDEVDDVARTIGAANTVTRHGDRLVATNTDWIGALRAIERELDVAGRRAVVLGAGGTARALVYGLRARGAEVIVLNRTLERAEQLARELGAERADGLEALADLAPDLIVNTTSVGLGEDRSPVAPQALGEGMVVMDAVYEPETTRLLADAEARGARTIGGKWMLVYQAAEQLRIWSEPLWPRGREAPIEEMALAFDAAGRSPRPVVGR